MHISNCCPVFILLTQDEEEVTSAAFIWWSIYSLFQILASETTSIWDANNFECVNYLEKLELV